MLALENRRVLRVLKSSLIGEYVCIYTSPSLAYRYLSLGLAVSVTVSWRRPIGYLTIVTLRIVGS